MNSHIFEYDGKTHIIMLPDNEADYMTREFLNKGHYHAIINTEDGVYMESVKKTFRTVVDVGANIGIFGHYMINHCGAVKPEKMICFEPYKESYDILCRNVPMGKNHRMAVGSKNEEAVQLGVYAPENDGMNRMVSLGDCSTTVYNDQIEVPTEVQQVTLDSFLGGHDVDDIDLIKIDVEGYENEVLMGATEILKKHEPDIFLELHGGFSPCAIQQFHDEVWPILRDWYGYESVYLFPEHDFVRGSAVVLSTDERWKDPHKRLPAIDHTRHKKQPTALIA